MGVITVKRSEKGYTTKPTAEDIKEITFNFKKANSNKRLSYKEIAESFESGHSLILADFNESNCNIKCESINSISCIALDIDSKDKPIDMFEMISIIYQKIKAYPIINYCTFSDTDNTRFRLVYRLGDKIDVEVYKTLYKALQWQFKQLDQQTSNPNRIWAGTNKKVYYNVKDIPITVSTIVKLINLYNKMLRRKEQKKKIELKGEYIKYENDMYIKPIYKKEILDYLIQNIDLKDFIERKFGGNFKRNGNNHIGCCSIHGGDNPTSLVISKNIYTCFTHCGTGNIITVAKKYYNCSNFSEIAFRLAEEYNLQIPKDYISGGN